MKSISNIHHKTSLPYKSTTTYTVEVLTWSITPPTNHQFITLGSHPLVAALVSEVKGLLYNHLVLKEFITYLVLY